LIGECVVVCLFNKQARALDGHLPGDGLADAWSTPLVAASFGCGRSAALKISAASEPQLRCGAFFPGLSYLLGVVFGFSI
jgi:hypothetical protein